MKKLLYLLLGLQIIAAAITFFETLSSSLLLALFQLVLNILTIALTLAVIYNTNDIENLKYDLNKLRSDFRKNDSPPKTQENTPPAVAHTNTARGSWECVKCGTVNKKDTTHCQNCKTEYSPFVNPTANPAEKKKVSRWVK